MRIFFFIHYSKKSSLSARFCTYFYTKKFGEHLIALQTIYTFLFRDICGVVVAVCRSRRTDEVAAMQVLAHVRASRRIRVPQLIGDTYVYILCTEV